MNNSKSKDSSSASAKQSKEKHMRLLHEYNNLKDATQTVLAALAQAKGLPLRALHSTYNLPSGE
ncbi:hypothetical protein KR222_010460 [Zaprionus bogoriensis]|nr:hypothetical protein KR222_010460 [Zaprionus bogoriensis]